MTIVRGSNRSLEFGKLSRSSRDCIGSSKSLLPHNMRPFGESCGASSWANRSTWQAGWHAPHGQRRLRLDLQLAQKCRSSEWLDLFGRSTVLIYILSSSHLSSPVVLVSSSCVGVSVALNCRVPIEPPFLKKFLLILRCSFGLMRARTTLGRQGA